MDVGVRELRDGLSRFLASVREGHTITVTDHGRPVGVELTAELSENAAGLTQISSPRRETRTFSRHGAHWVSPCWTRATARDASSRMRR